MAKNKNIMEADVLNEIVSVQQAVATAELNLELVMNLIVHHTERLTPADGAVIEILDGDEMVYRGVSGLAKDYLGYRISRAGSLSGLSMTEAKPLLCEDSETDPRVNKEACRKIGLRSMLLVPLQHSGKIVGVLKVLATEPAVFGDKDVRILQMMSGLLGAALSQSSSFEAIRERERKIVRLNTELQQRVEEQARTNEIMQSLIQASPIGIMVLNLDYNIILWNPSCEQIFGWKESEILGKAVPFIPAEKEGEFHATMARMTQSGQRLDIEVDRVRKDGGPIRLAVSALPLFDLGGKIYAYMSVISDITARFKKDLEILQANEALVAANRAKSDFLANMSHEIRTPINGVMGMAALLLETNLNPDQRLYTETIHSSADTLLVLVNDILDLSKAEAGKVEIESIDYDIVHIIGDVERTLAFTAKNKNLKVITQIPTELSSKWTGDPNRLRQVLMNLVNNGIKFTQQGEVSLSVQLEKQLGESFLRFEIKDTGIGMSPEVLSRIFRPFSQADSSTTRKFGGTGLGLSICHHLVSLMGGEIGVESTPGKGSCFWFTIKASVAKVTGEAPVISRAFKGQSPASRLRILLAEDNSVNRLIAVKMLESLGHLCVPVANGKEAVQALQSATYDLVLMDCQMPEMDGYEATRRIRSGSKDKAGIPIIALTANAMSGDKEKCLAAGMNSYVSKPIKLNDLQNIIEITMDDLKKTA